MELLLCHGSTWTVRGPKHSMYCECCHGLVFLISRVLRMCQSLPWLDELLLPMMEKQHGC
uniref:Uncharacterized protein n=1 Tax=Arundo donax TaxID=35708 RepID=A0A0A9EHR2_ARUDO